MLVADVALVRLGLVHHPALEADVRPDVFSRVQRLDAVSQPPHLVFNVRPEILQGVLFTLLNDAPYRYFYFFVQMTGEGESLDQRIFAHGNVLDVELVHSYAYGLVVTPEQDRELMPETRHALAQERQYAVPLQGQIVHHRVKSEFTPQ